MSSPNALKFTMIYRQTDALPLAASMDSVVGLPEVERFKNTAKSVLKKMGEDSSPSRCTSITHGDWCYHVLVDSGVMVLTLCDIRAPAWIAFAFLEDLLKELLSMHGADLHQVQRPFAYVKFDGTIQKTKKVYCDPRRSAEQDRAASEQWKPVRRELADVLGLVKSQAHSSADTGLSDKTAILIISGSVLAAVIMALLLFYFLS